MATCPKCGTTLIGSAGICPSCGGTIMPELPDNPITPDNPILPDNPLEPEDPVTPSFKCNDCGLTFSSQSEVNSHVCLPEERDNKLPKEQEDWWMTFLSTTNPNNGGAVSNRCPTWRRIFDWVKNYKGGVKTVGIKFQPTYDLISNVFYDLRYAFDRIPYKDLPVTLVSSSYSQSVSYESQTTERQEVFRFTTDSSSAREYIFGNFTVVLSGTGFNNNGGGAYSWGIRFYLCDSGGSSLANFNYIDKRISNAGNEYSYSESVSIITNWNTINYDFSPNTTYKVYAQLYTGNPFDGQATLQWMISGASPTVRCFIMDKCPKQFHAFGINRL